MGQTIAIIGAGLGLGLALARRFGREGFNVALIARNPARLAELVDALERDGIVAGAFAADVTDLDSLRSAVQAAAQQFGAINVLEYSPVVMPSEPEGWAKLSVTGMSAETALDSFRIMTLGAVAAVGEVLPAMRERGTGTILLTTGASAIHPLPMIGAWGIAGAGLINYARMLHTALDGTNVFVASVCLGVQVAKGDGPGDPDRLAEAYYALHRDRSRSELVIEQAQ